MTNAMGHRLWLTGPAGSHGEVTAGSGGDGSPAGGVINNKQHDKDDNDDDDARDECSDTPRDGTRHLLPFTLVIACSAQYCYEISF